MPQTSMIGQAVVLLALASPLVACSAAKVGEDSGAGTGPLKWKALKGFETRFATVNTHGGHTLLGVPGRNETLDYDFGQPFDFPVKDVAWTKQFGCAIDFDARLHCWGESQGDYFPHNAGLDGPYSQVDAHGRRVCMVRADSGAVECMGSWDTPERWDIKVVDQGPAQDLVVGDDSWCVHLEDSSVRCGQADTPRYIESFEAVPSGAFDGLVWGDNDGAAVACAWNANGLQCWGDEADDAMHGAPLVGAGTKDYFFADRTPCVLDDSGSLTCIDESGPLEEVFNGVPGSYSGVSRASSGAGMLCMENTGAQVVRCVGDFNGPLDVEIALDGTITGSDAIQLYPPLPTDTGE